MDGVNDELLFIGTGGAHLYYYLRIVLSSDKSVRDFKFLELDFPCLPSNDEINNASFNPLQSPIQLAIFDSDKDGIKDVFIHLDNQTAEANVKQLKKYRINSTSILITFKNRKVKLNDYSA
ncbi:MAG: hypothetical protein EOP48_34930 [Sphingobacteriales bacterium]|nr:MAG: hypothetical protein EOP48_34930 [Sphingobacteriales bacterium]